MHMYYGRESAITTGLVWASANKIEWECAAKLNLDSRTPAAHCADSAGSPLDLALDLAAPCAAPTPTQWCISCAVLTAHGEHTPNRPRSSLSAEAHAPCHATCQGTLGCLEALLSHQHHELPACGLHGTSASELTLGSRSRSSAVRSSQQVSCSLVKRGRWSDGRSTARALTMCPERVEGRLPTKPPRAPIHTICSRIASTSGHNGWGKAERASTSEGWSRSSTKRRV